MNLFGLLVLILFPTGNTWATQSHTYNHENRTTYHRRQQPTQSSERIALNSEKEEVSDEFIDKTTHENNLTKLHYPLKSQMNITTSRPYLSVNESEEYQRFQRKWSNLMENSSSYEAIPEKWLEPTNGKHDLHYTNENETMKRNPILIKLQQLMKRNQNKEVTHLENNDTHHYSIKQKWLTRFISSQLNNITRSGGQNHHDKHTEFTEYPGTNNSARAILYRKWTKYYECLENTTTFNPQVHYVFQGQSVRMYCDVCESPSGSPSIKWHHSTPRTGNKEKEVFAAGKTTAFSQNSRAVLSGNGKVLSLFGVRDDDAGNYTCSMFNQIVTPHQLQVADKKENITKVWPESAPGKPHPAPNVNLPEFAIRVWTEWKNWTTCSRCGWAGKRIRIGVCTVSALSEMNNVLAPAILTKFKNGIPCRSKLLPHGLHRHPKIALRQSEIMESFCKVPCPESGVYVVKDEKGTVIERADNAAGIYSKLQRLPRMPPPVQRTIVFQQQWESAYLLCPGSLHNDAPVRWFRGGKPILNETDRTHITPSHLLVINNLGKADSALYSCWQGKQLVGTVRLQVSVPVRLTFSQQISALSMILIAGTFIIIFGRAFFNSLNKT